MYQPRVAATSDIAGITSNGFNYTATYDSAVTDSIEWAATFRLGDVFRAIRHGRLFQAAALTQADLQWAVMADIEDASDNA